MDDLQRLRLIERLIKQRDIKRLIKQRAFCKCYRSTDIVH